MAQRTDALPMVNAAIDRRLSELGQTQAELARTLDVRPQTVNKWLSGENTPPPARWPAIEAALRFEGGHLARVAGIVPDERGPVDVISAIESDSGLDDRGRAHVLAAYRVELEHSAAASRARSDKTPPTKARSRKS